VKLYRGKKNLAAFTVILIITFLIVIPTLLFLSALVAQGVESVNRVNAWLNAGNLQHLGQDPKVIALIDRVREHFPFLEIEKVDFQAHLIALSKSIGQFLLSKGASLLGDVAHLVSRFFVMIFVIFYVVRDGKEMLDGIKFFSPLRKEQEDKILDGVRLVARSVLLGSFLTALCQGIAGGVGLTIVGIPGLFWGTVMGFASLIPIIGTAIVWIPCAIYLLLLGKMKLALFFAIWSIFLVGSIDNFLRPFLMRGQSMMSPFYIFLAIIGGVQYFGLAGILYGPLVLSFAMLMLLIYSVEFRELLESKQSSLVSREEKQGECGPKPAPDQDG
jgi:predicted PurR-regulated permease PerM